MISIQGSKNGPTWAWNPATQWTACVTLNKSLKQSEIPFPHLKNADENNI